MFKTILNSYTPLMLLLFTILTPELSGGAWPQGLAQAQTQIQRNESGMFQPRTHVPVSYRDNHGNLEIAARAGQLYVSVENSGAPPQSIKLPYDLVQANEIRRVGPDRAAVLGMENGDIFYVAILDLRRLNVSDRFVCYFPTFSPDARYIAFVKFSVAHPDGPVESHYMLYDVTKSTSDNRPSGVDAQDWMNVGVTMYPTGIGNKPLDNYGRDDHETATTKFMWNHRSDAVLFADRSHEVLSLVLVSIGSDGSLHARRVDLSLADICSKDLSVRRNQCLVNLTEARFDNESTGGVAVVIKDVGIDALLQPQTYQFKYSQFK